MVLHHGTAGGPILYVPCIRLYRGRGGVSGVATTHHIFNMYFAVLPHWRAPVFSYGQFILFSSLDPQYGGSRESAGLQPVHSQTSLHCMVSGKCSQLLAKITR